MRTAQWACLRCRRVVSILSPGPVAPIMASPEYTALQRSTDTLCNNISGAASPVWFAQKLQAKGLITPQLQQKMQTLGVSNYDKVAELLQAAVTQVKIDAENFNMLVEILREEPALEGSVTALTYALKEAQKQKKVNPATSKPSKKEEKLKTLAKAPLKDIINALHKAGFVDADWEQLGMQLNVAQLDNIRADRSEAATILMEMIKQWRRSDVNASWESLADALGMIGKYGSATAEGFRQAVGLPPVTHATVSDDDTAEEAPPPPEEQVDGEQERQETLRKRPVLEAPPNTDQKKDPEEPRPPAPPTVERTVLAGFMNQLLMVGLILVIAILVVIFEKSIVPYFI